jgi:ELWxxDGT repeat protein
MDWRTLTATDSHVQRLEPRRLLAATPLTDSSSPGAFYDDAAAGTLYFAASDGVHGRELWKSDGTTAGTVMVKDILPGGVGAAPHMFIAFGGATYFLTRNLSNDPQLWRTDGTADGTRLLADLRAVAGREVFPTRLVSAGGALFVAMKNELDDYNVLITSDGTTAGTTRVRDFRGFFFTILGAVNDRLLLGAMDEAHGHELWQTDGTAAGTVLVKDINPGPANASPGDLYTPDVAILNDEMYFAANDGAGGALWKSDGTAAGTVKVSDDVTPALGPNFLTFDDAVFFRGGSFQTGLEIWKTDGTADGTVKVEDIELFGGTKPLALGGYLYFTPGGPAGADLWKTDGTPGGTVPVKDIDPEGYGTSIRSLTALNGLVYFVSRGPGDGRELWRSDGTADGTVVVSDIAAGEDYAFDNFEDDRLSVSGGALYFGADDGTNGTELWKSDGTTAGTALLKDINATPASFVTKLSTPLGTDPWGVSGTGADDTFTVTRDGDFVVISRNGKNEQVALRPGEQLWFDTGDGNDSVDASALDTDVIVVVRGGNGDDTLVGGGSGDSLYGGAGADRLAGGGSSDLLSGGGGNDHLQGDAGKDRLYGFAGDDTLHGGSGDDRLFGHDGRDRLHGNSGNDALSGGAQGDWLYGQGGNDQLNGDGGNDRLYGDHATGTDTLYGGAGNDLLVSRDSVADHLFGGRGADTSVADAEDDVLAGIESVG